MIQNKSKTVYTKNNVVYIKHRDLPPLAVARIIKIGNKFLLFKRRDVLSRSTFKNLNFICETARKIGLDIIMYKAPLMLSASDGQFIDLVTEMMLSDLDMCNYSKTPDIQCRIIETNHDKKTLSDCYVNLMLTS